MKKPSIVAAPIELNRDQMHLGYCETRLNGLSVNAPGSTELARVRAARDEIIARMDPADLAAYRKAANLAMTPEQRAEDAERQAEAEPR